MGHLRSVAPIAVVVVALLALAVDGCAGAPPSLAALGAPVVKPTPTPTPIASPTAPPAPPPLPPAAPYRIALDAVTVASSSNAEILGLAPPPVDAAAVDRAVAEATARLAAFLDAQLAQPGSWFSDRGVAVMTDPAQLDPATRAAAAVLDGASTPGWLHGTVTGSAAGTARVVADGPRILSVSLAYSASFDLVVLQGTDLIRGPVQHQGVVSFAADEAGLRVVAWDPTTTYGGDLGTVL